MSRTAAPCRHVSTKTWAWLLRVRVRVNMHVIVMLARWRRLFVGKEALLLLRDGSKPGGGTAARQWRRTPTRLESRMTSSSGRRGGEAAKGGHVAFCMLVQVHIISILHIRLITTFSPYSLVFPISRHLNLPRTDNLASD